VLHRAPSSSVAAILGHLRLRSPPFLPIDRGGDARFVKLHPRAVKFQFK
jgi:hypothetical protein